ncbi:hypothetical protein V4F39_20450 [Aquincola sp. MAHUQ-54]|uniref:Uncharacterized protein n=1 Tax=Aquincola agrisoli TaxID=3119538 RepID=A0AAW9QHH7_9BURK
MTLQFTPNVLNLRSASGANVPGSHLEGDVRRQDAGRHLRQGADRQQQAGGIAGPGLLSTSVDVSATGFGSAVATSRFTGSFLNGVQVDLNLDFTALDFAVGSG